MFRAEVDFYRRGRLVREGQVRHTAGLIADGAAILASAFDQRRGLPLDQGLLTMGAVRFAYNTVPAPGVGVAAATRDGGRNALAANQPQANHVFTSCCWKLGSHLA